MRFEDIRERLESVGKDRLRALIDPQRFQLFHCPVALEVFLSGAITTEQVRTADRVLGHFSLCVEECERLFEDDFTAKHIRENNTVVEPAIVIPDQNMLQEIGGEYDWYIVIRHPEYPDFALDIVFQDLTAVGIWGSC